jgi:hypothetical protein
VGLSLRLGHAGWNRQIQASKDPPRHPVQRLRKRPRRADSNERTNVNRTSRFTRIPTKRLAVEGNNPGAMKRLIVGLATTVLVSGGLGLAGLGLVEGTAQAAPVFTQCPGDTAFTLDPQDMQKLAELPGGLSVCQRWYYDAEGNVVAGVPGPGKPPPSTPGDRGVPVPPPLMCGPVPCGLFP